MNPRREEFKIIENLRREDILIKISTNISSKNTSFMYFLCRVALTGTEDLHKRSAKTPIVAP